MHVGTSITHNMLLANRLCNPPSTSLPMGAPLLPRSAVSRSCGVGHLSVAIARGFYRGIAFDYRRSSLVAMRGTFFGSGTTRINPEARSVLRGGRHVVLCSGAAAGPPVTKEATIEQIQVALRAQLTKGVMQTGPTSTSAGFGSRSSKRKKNKMKPKASKGTGQRYLVEVPLADESAAEYTDLLLGVLDGLDVPVMLFTGDPACAAGVSSGELPNVTTAAIQQSVDQRVPGGTMLVVIVGLQETHLDHVRRVTTASSCPVVLINSPWDPSTVAGIHRDFMESFEVLYSYMPLAIQGFFANSQGAVFKHVTSGPPMASPWQIFWEGKVIQELKTRPTPEELEVVLYDRAAKDSAMVKAAGLFANAKDKLTGKR